ncbi:helix-turn-helix domain-containing protein [Rhizobium sp. IBUN]|uniref:helix-turn-helix transcriptional regulator n=1 Tax=Rhizobium sp. IBUN TaxID=1042326 RepID=UPI000408ED1E|nr:helix-turn-helix domain-containing protein [Rhizobium sp. IBUN]
MAGAVNATAIGGSSVPMDLLLLAIKAYDDGLAAYNAFENDDLLDDGEADLFAATIEGPHDVLAKWRTPASTREAALAAVSLAEREKAIFGASAVADAMEMAAIAFLKNSAGAPSKPTAIEVPARIGLEGLAPDTLLTAPESAAYLRLSGSTLARWRSTKRGPAYAKIGGIVTYRVSALLDFVAKSERKGTRPEK